MTIQMTPEQMLANAATIKAKCAAIQTELDKLKEDVNQFVTTHWDGAANNEFAAFMGNWKTRNDDLTATLNQAHVAVETGIHSMVATDGRMGAQFGGIA